MTKEEKELYDALVKGVQEKMTSVVDSIVTKSLETEEESDGAAPAAPVVKKSESDDSEVMKAINGLSTSVQFLIKKEEKRAAEEAKKIKKEELTKTYNEAITKAIAETMKEYGIEKTEDDDSDGEVKKVKTSTKSMKKSKVGTTKHSMDKEDDEADPNTISMKKFNKMDDSAKDEMVAKSFADAMGFNALKAIKDASREPAKQEEDEDDD